MTDFTNKEPLRLWFPELNSAQISKLREMLKAEYERGVQDSAFNLYMHHLTNATMKEIPKSPYGDNQLKGEK